MVTGSASRNVVYFTSRATPTISISLAGVVRVGAEREAPAHGILAAKVAAHEGVRHYRHLWARPHRLVP